MLDQPRLMRFMPFLILLRACYFLIFILFSTFLFIFVVACPPPSIILFHFIDQPLLHYVFTIARLFII